MNRNMYDACSPGNIPHGSQLVAGYVDPGACQWPFTALEPSSWPGRTLVTITRDPAYVASVLDIENGAASIDDIAPWMKAGRGHTVYVSLSNWPAATDAARSAGVTPYWWVADWTRREHCPSGAVACQYLPTPRYDLSVVVDDDWPVPRPRPQEVPDMPFLCKDPNSSTVWVVAGDLSSRHALVDLASYDVLTSLGYRVVGMTGSPPGLSAAELASIPQS